MRLAVICFTLLICSQYVHADEAPPPSQWQGVWHGKIGNYPITTCLKQSDDDVAGAYYYDKRLQLISLHQPEGAPRGAASLDLVESVPLPPSDSPKKAGPTPSANWKLSASPVDAKDAVLVGTFTIAGADNSRKQLPIRLVREKIRTNVTQDHEQLFPQADSPCASDAFNNTRETPPIIVNNSGADKDAVAISQTLDFGGHLSASVDGFTLAASDPASKRFNQILHQKLVDAGREAMDCTRNALDTENVEGEYTESMSLVLLTSHLLVIGTSGGYECGGVHPGAYQSYETWDIAKAEKINPWTWFNTTAVKLAPVNEEKPSAGYSVAIQPGLREVLVRHWSRDDDEDCKSIGREQNEWMVFPTKDGITFTPELPHVIFACTDDVPIPYAEIRPLLNAAGAAVLKEAVRSANSGK